MKSLFISHGAPNLVLSKTPAADFLASRLVLPAVSACVVVSAHWCTRGVVRVMTSGAPETIHDFAGFEEELYALQYPAAGEPQRAAKLAEALQALLKPNGLPVQTDALRGLDHGVWVPLMLARPQADVPVIAVSLPYPASAEQALVFGAALGKAVDLVFGGTALVIGSGAITHRLAAFGAYALHGGPAPEAAQFRDWMAWQLESGNRDALIAYRTQAPHAIWNHPTDEHLLPLLVALAAGDESGKLSARCLHSSWEWGILAMDVWQFGE